VISKKFRNIKQIKKKAYALL